MTHGKRPWCWKRLRAAGEGDDRGWDGWMASLTQWTWVWASSGRRWRTGRHGVLQSVGLQRVGQTERLSSNNKAALALLASWLFFILCLQHWTVSSRGIHRLQSYWRRGLSLTREARRVHCSFHLGWGWRVGIWPRLGQSNVSSWLESLLNDTKTTALIIRHWFNVHMGIAPSRGRQLHCLTGRWNPGCWKRSCRPGLPNFCWFCHILMAFQ